MRYLTLPRLFTCACALLGGMGQQAAASDRETLGTVSFTSPSFESNDYEGVWDNVVYRDYTQQLLATQQLHISVREDLQIEWSLTRVFSLSPEPDPGLALGLHVNFK